MRFVGGATRMVLLHVKYWRVRFLHSANGVCQPATNQPITVKVVGAWWERHVFLMNALSVKQAHLRSNVS